jgi:hypothetical protein
VKRVLDERDLRYATDDAGDFAVNFERDAESGAALTLTILIRGSDDATLTFRVRADTAVPVSLRLDLLTALNEWQSSRYWPMVFAVERDSGALEVICEHSLDLTAGTSKGLIDSAYMLSMTSSRRLYRWLRSERSLL